MVRLSGLVGSRLSYVCIIVYLSHLTFSAIEKNDGHAQKANKRPCLFEKPCLDVDFPS